MKIDFMKQFIFYTLKNQKKPFFIYFMNTMDQKYNIYLTIISKIKNFL